MKKTLYNFSFSCRDNGGKYQSFNIKAGSPAEAEKKGFEKARKKAHGDIYPGSWECKLILTF